MLKRWIGAAVVATATLGGLSATAGAGDPRIERGKYLVAVISCTDCHTNGSLAGKPDVAHFLGGSDIGFAIPGLGYFYGPNLTPDPETGLGNWTREQIVTAITRGERPDGRILAPIMPWHSFGQMTPEDAEAMAAYLQSLAPVKHKVPGPFGAEQKPTAPYLTLAVPPTP
jgi:mono/diheme cytochrome c family protein